VNDAVTITMRRKVKPGRKAECKAWLKRPTESAGKEFAGYLGVELHRPATDGVDRSMSRSGSHDGPDGHENLDPCTPMLTGAPDQSATDAAWDWKTGPEFCFSAAPSCASPRHNAPHGARADHGGSYSGAGAEPCAWAPDDRLAFTRRPPSAVTIQDELMTYVMMSCVTQQILQFIRPKQRTL
jgi:hypothetical protein